MLRLLDPPLLIPVGGLAIAAQLGPARLADVVGRRFELDGRVLIPLPHPSGASAWTNAAANRALIAQAVGLIGVRAAAARRAGLGRRHTRARGPVRRPRPRATTLRPPRAPRTTRHEAARMRASDARPHHPHHRPMAARGQATVEWLGIALAIAVLLGSAVLVGGDLPRLVARGLLGDRSVRQGDRWALLHEHWGAVVRRHAPILVLERDRHGDDASVPVDFRTCREVACARARQRPPRRLRARAAARARRRCTSSTGSTTPTSQTSHLPLPALQGAHRDDWEGVVVRIDKATGAVSARASAHGGFAGAGPWWSAASGWRPIDGRPVVFRAAGSHANGFGPADVDLAGDAWNGTLSTLDDLVLLPADEAPSARRRFAPEASPPWAKAAWRDPEVSGTGAAGGRDGLARAAEAWASARGALPSGLRPTLEAT